jgi:hypothetical protein
MRHPGTIAVTACGAMFVGSLFFAVAADPLTSHDVLPKSAFALSSGTTTMSSVAVTSISGLPISNNITDVEYAAFFPSPTVGELVGLPLVERNGAWRLLWPEA